jgi:hypothetical protein
MFLSLPQWDVKVPQAFKFVAAAFNFIIVAHFKNSISQPCVIKL